MHAKFGGEILKLKIKVFIILTGGPCYGFFSSLISFSNAVKVHIGKSGLILCFINCG